MILASTGMVGWILLCINKIYCTMIDSIESNDLTIITKFKG